MSLPVRQSVAQRWTLYARAGAAVAGLMTAIVFLLPSPKPRTQELLAGAETPPPPPRRERVSPTHQIGPQEWTRVAPVLDTLDAQPIRQFKIRLEQEKLAIAQNTAAEAEQPDGTTTTRGGFPPPWRYIGALREGERLSALIVVDGKQRFIQEGFAMDGYSVARIESARLVVVQGRQEHQLRLVENPLLGQIFTGAPYPAGFGFPDRSGDVMDPGRRTVPTPNPSQTPRRVTIPTTESGDR